MLSLRECIAEAVKNKVAVGHFNASTLDGVWAIADAAHELKLPVIVGVSEGERDYLGVNEVAAVVKSIRENRNQPIFLNADHTYSFDRVKEVVDAGFDAVIFDGAKLPLDENIEITKKCVEYAREYSSKSGREIIVEGELGFIGQSSKVLDEIPAGAAVTEDQMTRPEDAARFVAETGVDLLAPAVGNVHGVVVGGDPALNIRRVKSISEMLKSPAALRSAPPFSKGESAQPASVPLVLHGASGNSADDIKKAIRAGVAIVHVNTELRLAYRSALVRSLSEDPEEISPYKYLKPAKLAMQKVIEEKLRIFNDT